jgi:hypothetical protein
MLISLTLESRTRKLDTWLIASGTVIHRVTVPRVTGRDTITTLRYVINRTLKLNSTDYTFLGNRRANGMWFTEWYKHRASLFDLADEAYALTSHNPPPRQQ